MGSWRNDVKDMASRNFDNNKCIFFEMEYDRAVRCGCYKYLAINELNESISSTFKRGKKFGYSIDLENLFDLCGGTDHYITARKENQEAKDLNLNLDESSTSMKMQAVLQCRLDRTAHSASPGNGTLCNLNPATPTSAPQEIPTPSPVNPTPSPVNPTPSPVNP